MAGDPRIAIDLRPFDAPSAAGQARYARDLVRELAALEPPASFSVVVGSAQVGGFPVPPWWDVHVLPIRSGRGAYLANRLRTGWAARRHRWDLVHTLHTWAPLPRPRSHVYTVYDLMMDRFPEYHAVRASRAHRDYRRAATSADALIAISDATARDLRSLWGVPERLVRVVPLAQDASAWSAHGVTQDSAPTVLSPYNLEPRKNLASLIDAFALVRARHPDARLVLYGRAAVTEERERAFAERVERSGTTSAVVRTGLLTDTELAAWYRRAHVLAFPSLYEGYGLPMLEAMHAGLPVVAHDSPAAQEVLGPAGILTDATNPSTLAHALQSLLTDPARRRALAALGLTRARARTSADVARETWAVYDHVLGAPA